MPLTINHSLLWMMLAFADWSSTGTHYQVSYFSDVLPELHSNSVTAINFMTYMLWNAVWVFMCQKRHSSTVKAVQKKSVNKQTPATNNAFVTSAPATPSGVHPVSFFSVWLCGWRQVCWRQSKSLPAATRSIIKTSTNTQSCHFHSARS